MSHTAFAFDPDWMSTLTAAFMANAFLAGLCIALAAGVMGYFTIARHSTFASHALAHIGLPGATGAILIGLPAWVCFLPDSRVLPRNRCSRFYSDRF